jgi:uncharacterized protein YeaO (DUF488 family)
MLYTTKPIYKVATMTKLTSAPKYLPYPDEGELREGYIAKWKKYPTDEVKIRVARPSVLGPSQRLLDIYKYEGLAWDIYERLFRKEILGNPKALAKIDEIRKLLADGTNVRLICYEKNPPCHRFILMNMIKEASS